MQPIKAANPEEWFSGVVVAGARRGRGFGFPTANVVLDQGHDDIPTGIWAGRAHVPSDGQTYLAAIHVGPRPTFDDKESIVEAHLIDFPDRTLYGEKLKLQFVERLRDVLKFADPADLVQEMHRDRQRTRDILGPRE